MQRIIIKYKIKIATIFLFILYPFYSICQGRNFTIKVHFDNPDIKTLIIGEAYYDRLKPYHAANLKSDSANINGNTYLFKGTLLYPTAVRLFSNINSEKLNELIFIDTGYQEIKIIKKDNSYFINSTTEIEVEHKKFLKEMAIKNIDENIDGEKLLKYVQKKPNSYIAFFALINQSCWYPANPIFWKIKDLFDIKIKKTKAYQYYKVLNAPDKKLLEYVAYTKKKESLKLNFNNSKDKYTLLIFWSLSCAPCLKEMEQMKGEYTEHLREKFDIMTVNLDEKKYFIMGLNYIQKQKFPWKNYWDWNQENILKHIFITHFPSSFLLDSSSRIVAQDLDFNKITEFLR